MDEEISFWGWPPARAPKDYQNESFTQIEGAAELPLGGAI